MTEYPYAGTSGWSGSDTSRERAERDDMDGTTTARQRAVMALLSDRRWLGATYAEVGRTFGWHHGQASGVLSVLHKTGHVARLADVRRDRCAVYVLPEHVQDRATAPYRPNRARRLSEVSEDELWAELARRDGWVQ